MVLKPHGVNGKMGALDWLKNWLVLSHTDNVKYYFRIADCQQKVTPLLWLGVAIDLFNSPIRMTRRPIFFPRKVPFSQDNSLFCLYCENGPVKGRLTKCIVGAVREAGIMLYNKLITEALSRPCASANHPSNNITETLCDQIK